MLSSNEGDNVTMRLSDVTPRYSAPSSLVPERLYYRDFARALRA
jgi:hypothetical protein